MTKLKTKDLKPSPANERAKPPETSGEFAARMLKEFPNLIDPVFGGPDGSAMIFMERVRAMGQEGWTPEHDDQHINHELASAALAFIGLALNNSALVGYYPTNWDQRWITKHYGDDPINLYKIAGQFCAAEIDRLLRKQARQAKTGLNPLKAAIAQTYTEQLPPGQEFKFTDKKKPTRRDPMRGLFNRYNAQKAYPTGAVATGTVGEMLELVGYKVPRKSIEKWEADKLKRASVWAFNTWERAKGTDISQLAPSPDSERPGFILKRWYVGSNLMGLLNKKFEDNSGADRMYAFDRMTALKDILNLTGYDIPLDVIRKWSRAKMEQALDYANRVYLKANGNRVNIPPKPKCLLKKYEIKE